MHGREFDSAASVVAGVVLLVFAVSAEVGRLREPTRRDIIASDPIVDERQLLLQQNALDRAFLPTVRALAARTRRLTPVGWLETLEHRLRLAGWRGRNALERVLALKLVLGLAGALLTIFLVASGLTVGRAGPLKQPTHLRPATGLHPAAAGSGRVPAPRP